MAGAGATREALTKEQLENLPIPLPPLDEQRRIAAILDQADALRDKRRQALAQVEQLTQSVFLEMFGEDNRFPRTALADLVKPETIITYGIVQAGDDYEGGVPYVRTGDIVGGRVRENGLLRTTPEIASKYSRTMLETGDTHMSVRATVGTTAMVPTALKGANLSRGIARIAPAESVDGTYLLEYIRSDSGQRWIASKRKGITFLEINIAKLREMPVPIPP